MRGGLGQETCDARSHPRVSEILFASDCDAAQQASLAQLVERGTSISGSCRGHRFDSVRRHLFLDCVERACVHTHSRSLENSFGVRVVYMHKV
jgi:hypothetical protein